MPFNTGPMQHCNLVDLIDLTDFENIDHIQLEVVGHNQRKNSLPWTDYLKWRHLVELDRLLFPTKEVRFWTGILNRTYLNEFLGMSNLILVSPNCEIFPVWVLLRWILINLNKGT